MKLIPLDKNSPRDLPFTPSRRRPWKHQLAMMHRCLKLENGYRKITVRGIGYKVRTRMALLSAKAGSGKTDVILELIKHSKIPMMTSKTVLCGGMSSITVDDPKCVETSLVVTEHTLSKQWEHCAEQFEMSYIKICSFKELKKGEGLEGLDPPNAPTRVYNHDKVSDVLSGRHKMVILTSAAYKELSEFPGIRRYEVMRTVFDEADTIVVPNVHIIPTRMLWVVTATANCFYTNDRSGAGSKSKVKMFDEMFKLPKEVAGAKNSREYVLRRELHEATIASNTVFCKEEFIDESCDLEPVQFMKIKCEEIAFEQLKEFCTVHLKGYQQSLATEAFKRIDVGTPKSDDLLKIFKNLELEISRDTESVRDTVPLVEWMRGRCAYTLTELTDENRAKVDGMNHVFVDKRLEDFQESAMLQVLEVLKSYSKVASVAATINRIRSIRNSKILLFTEEKLKDSPLIKELDRLKIHYKTHIGTGATVDKRVTDLRDGKINLLILKKKSASGLNLQCCTHIVFAHVMDADIYTQAVARGQRPGRIGPLVVYDMQKQ